MSDARGENMIVLEVFGEGKTDIGKESPIPSSPEEGVVPILVHRLCGKPHAMQVKTKRYAHLQQGKRLWQKVRFSKRQAYYNKGTEGAVFVVDTEGNDKVVDDLAKGRNYELPDFPMAVGAPRPCIEAWLLGDPSAVSQGRDRSRCADLPEDPEALPAPRVDPAHNPKTVLARHGVDSQAQKDSIAERLDLNAVRERCPLSFEPFATEVERRLRPLFP